MPKSEQERSSKGDLSDSRMEQFLTALEQARMFRQKSLDKENDVSRETSATESDTNTFDD